MTTVESNGPITKEFLETTFGEEISDFSVSPGSKDGDNYMSVMYAVDLTLKESGKTRNVILKTYPTLPARQEMLKKFNVFHSELEVYRTWMPELIRFQKEAGLEKVFEPAYAGFVNGVSIDFAKEGVDKYSSPLDNYIMMENLKASGFLMHSRQVPLDLDHVSYLVQELAKVHSLSWCYKKIYNLNYLSEKYSFLNPPLLDTMLEEMKMFLGNSFDTAKKTLTKKLGSNSELTKGVAKLEPNAFDVIKAYWSNIEQYDGDGVEKYHRITPTSSRKEKPWELLLHGDIWVANMLFKYEKGSNKPTGVKLVDLQGVHEGDPCSDLAYAIHASTDAQFREKHTDTFLQLYYDTFMRVCNALKVEPLADFSMSELKRRYHLSRIFGLVMAIMGMPIMMKDASKAIKLEELSQDLDSADFFDVITRISDDDENPLYEERLMGIVREMYNAGVM